MIYSVKLLLILQGSPMLHFHLFPLLKSFLFTSQTNVEHTPTLCTVHKGIQGKKIMKCFHVSVIEQMLKILY